MGPDRNPYLIPASIIVAGALVAFAVFYVKAGPGTSSPSDSSFENSLSPAAKNIRPVSDKDHILGNPDAPIKIVEFSDLECPFCKSFHPTMKRIVEEYGKDGRVAWVYRHFPLDSIHPKARKEAEAAECAAELGGNQAFWAYVDKIFEVTPSNNRLEPSELPKIAEEVGLERGKFEVCLDSGKYAERVAKDLEDAINSGGDGTPYSVVITKDGDFFPFSGALPYQQVKAIVEQALNATL
ncbi:hypothetical protein A2757_02765 [Candidatus Giovannonibacteria bacterium RIFCSPHIGHO2_01_FULL_48_47]|nr:MAG: hypothetical protein A2757_02765 [Candidatus Giovannonibacteria bacterium RIFCSPHIGHO2_01_FULL_48_47]OGF67607.1 MAG: hypothetical protein A3D61_01865 [Candidatus Giovannonibacteria bacterium RIFCSPHIGHO2_02_FULL_48_15]OGF95993.1 MAG: hypothetical protein A2613_00250 [Candidatus Giovannonibacteria bacterium RIFOXYD1_FULL_48_21]HBT81412.1 disulfide bond formation protein DsbA [Candidatus Giovannonibacteria bacterium]